VGLGACSVGFAFAWPSPVIPHLTDCKNNPLKPDGCSVDDEFTADEISWIGSLAPLGALLASIFMGVPLDKLGRKNTLLLASAPSLAGWALLGLTEPLNMGHPVYFFIGRFLTGNCVVSTSLFLMAFYSQA